MLPPLILVAGVGLPEVASWLGVYSASTFPFEKPSAHRLPELSKARPSAPPRTEPVMVTVAAGLPDVAIWAGVNSTIEPPELASHRSPWVSNVGNVGSTSPPFDSVTAGVGLPEVVSWPGVNS